MKLTINRNYKDSSALWSFNHEGFMSRSQMNLVFDLLDINDSLSLDQAQREAEIVKRLAQEGIDAEFVGG